MVGLDVILGMDWLAKHHASVDCFRKEVVFRSPGRPEVTFYVAYLRGRYVPLMIELRKLIVELGVDEQGALLATLQVRPVLVERIIAAQAEDPLICTLRAEVESGDRTDRSVRNDEALKRKILEEAHSSAFAMHPGSTKMYHTLREHYWWPFMKKEIAEYVRKCLICQQVKAER
ncbi:hypothetical protein L3X38_025284 [Prunus dulcis]|uniref:Integrase zinc-binding domain-containing protein n=1 Tax=Prunus dulcis TaxID=3755 RepID=A0AAD4Z771_PRUDU|nr:hypothetical protein L3X38_025284 [Prunus dulcis]